MVDKLIRETDSLSMARQQGQIQALGVSLDAINVLIQECSHE